MLATEQATPCHKHERALFRTLRFIKSQLHFYDPKFRVGDAPVKNDLQLYVDASWGTPSVTGYVIFWRGNMIKALSRVQQSVAVSACVAISACEAELVATAHGCQETLGVSQLLSFFKHESESPIRSIDDFLKADTEALPRGIFAIQTDSRSGQGFLQNDGFSRRTRHPALSFNFSQRLIYNKILHIIWVATKVQIY